MSILRKIVALSFVLLWLVACSDDSSSGEVVRRIDENGNTFSPATVKGDIVYMPSMTPEKVRIVKLKYDLSPVDSFDVPLTSYSWSETYEFTAPSSDYESPYVKIVTVFPAQGDKKMEFGQYSRLDGSYSDFRLYLHLALMADRVKVLVDKEDYDFEKAQKTALEELEKIFGSNLSDVAARGFKNVVYGNLGGVSPYVYCRHEISDSVFYSDFKKFRETFAQKGTVDSSMIVTAADAWLSTFEILVDSMYYLAKGGARDSAYGLANLDSVFIWKAYDMSVKDSVATIRTKSSDYYGRSLYREWIGDGRSSILLWRLLSSLEDSLGICKHYEEKLIQRNDTLYACRNNSHIWEIVTERDSLFNHQYGECSWYKNRGQPLYVHDSLFVCECENMNSCTWSDKYVKRVFLKGDTMYAKVLDAKATAVFGKCDNFVSVGGEVQKLGDVYVQCKLYNWTEVDSLIYFLGECYGNDKGEHLGAYYSCSDDDDFSKHDWVEILAPVYYDSICYSENANEILKFGEDYFICEMPETCKGVDGFAVPFCDAIGNWRKLNEKEIIPPVADLQWCTSAIKNKKVVYNGTFYECNRGKWREVNKDTLAPPEKDGLLCGDTLIGVIKHYGYDYYKCDTNRVWNMLQPKEKLPLQYRDSLGLCDSTSNKVLHWNEYAQSFVGCTTKDSIYEWDVVNVGTSPYTLPPSLSKKKLAGGSLMDSVYTVTADGVEYRFNIVKKSYTTNYYNLILEHMKLDGKGYAAYSYNGKIYLHSERGTDSLLLKSIENKSDTYDDFYADWKTRLAKDCKCGSINLEVHEDSLSVIFYDKNTYVDYDKAKTFCPKGFHIPDSTEFMQKFKYATASTDFRNDSPLSWYFRTDRVVGCSASTIVHADLFWTGTEKDADTQYCYESSMTTVTMEEKSRRIVECPKDLYPMVQVLCVMDE